MMLNIHINLHVISMQCYKTLQIYGVLQHDMEITYKFIWVSIIIFEEYTNSYNFVNSQNLFRQL